MQRLLASSWLVPLIGLVVIDRFDGDLVDALGYDRAAATVVLIGALLGAAWYLGAPRPLADRLFPFCIIGLIVLAITFTPGETTTDMPAALSLAGIVGGLTIAERLRPLK